MIMHTPSLPLTSAVSVSCALETAVPLSPAYYFRPIADCCVTADVKALPVRPRIWIIYKIRYLIHDYVTHKFLENNCVVWNSSA